MFGDLIDLDFGSDFAPDEDWLSALGNLGAPGDLGDFFLDSETGEIVSAAEAQQLADLDVSGSGSGPVSEAPFGGALDDAPVSRSTSDILRSREGSPTTWTPGTEPFDWTQMADPTASIASAGGMDWAKLLAQGLKGLSGLGGFGKSLAEASTPASGLGSTPSIPGLMSAPPPPMVPSGLGGGIPRIDIGGQDLPRMAGLESAGLDGVPRGGALGGLDDPGGINAVLSHLQADPGARMGLQAAIDAGPAPRPFTPLVIPTAAGGGGAMASSLAPRMSGLQRLMLERFG